MYIAFLDIVLLTTLNRLLYRVKITYTLGNQKLCVTPFCSPHLTALVWHQTCNIFKAYLSILKSITLIKVITHQHNEIIHQRILHDTLGEIK